MKKQLPELHLELRSATHGVSVWKAGAYIQKVTVVTAYFGSDEQAARNAKKVMRFAKQIERGRA